MSTAHHSIKAIVRRTGLTAHVIRIWERRYGAVEPHRTDTNRRLYSDGDIERLSLLKDLTGAGHSISAVAKLPIETLRKMADEASLNGSTRLGLKGGSEASPHLSKCMAAVNALDFRGLERALDEAAAELGSQGLLQKVIAPLAQTIGDQWRDGVITAAHEHFASAVIRVFLGHAAKPFAAADSSPVLVVATPSGQLHELGALLAGAAAANLGWHVTYLGASLPAAEIAGAARQNRARAVALSLVYPEDDPHVEGELTRLRHLLPPEVAILAGGRAAAAYGDALEKIGARPMNDLASLCSALDDLRRTGNKRSA